MLDVKRLRVLREVAAQGSFSGAAESLAYTQSAISQQIAALEREAGTKLVERSARAVRLTEAGEALVGHADAILARLQAAERDLEAIAGLRGGRVRVVAFPSAGASLMPMAVAAFRERHPGVELILEPREPDEALVALKAGEADVAVTLEAGFAPIEDEAIETVHLLDDPMFVALPGDHPMAAKARLRLEDLQGEAWIQGTSRATCPDTRIFLRTCAACGFEPRMAFQSDDYAAIQGFIAAGVGVALIPDLALTTPRDDIAIRTLVGVAPRRRVLAATLAGSARGPATQAMVAILEEVGRGWQASRHDLQLAS
ncbi:LysR family transcriptional regulator [Capillimicrobium parvum]|uniref:HTH-type transcriptional regulator GltC n=1 Tax=Capillimicrobium parvum TaxID=2884022 RepID=A0A9E6XVQ4_9ACTN|nr:LysR family transcriptional regulator [Capillimicrobium parvum]UGS35269.1 HTH-type transcriptional regulator GltC [Capillimicrobium parvum]